MIRNDFIWVEKYRPRTVNDCIIPDASKKVFQSFVEKGEIPNLLLAGSAGIGKTSVAKALCEELGADYIIINGSDEGRFLDTVRNQAKGFASTVSLQDSACKHKVIIIDEADNTTNDVQLLLRASIEEFNRNCRFIFTCNYKNKIIEPLHSRCSVVEFSARGPEKAALAGQFFNRVRTILEKENVQFDDKVVAKLVQKHFPDFRRTLNELQRYAATGAIDSAILASADDLNINGLISSLKNKKFAEVRKWVVQNLDNDTALLFRKIYEAAYVHLQPISIAQAVLILGKYQYQAAFAADQEINTLACLTEIMMECEFK